MKARRNVTANVAGLRFRVRSYTKLQIPNQPRLPCPTIALRIGADTQNRIRAARFEDLTENLRRKARFDAAILLPSRKPRSDSGRPLRRGAVRLRP
jgi:hypothetical protein